MNFDHTQIVRKIQLFNDTNFNALIQFVEQQLINLEIPTNTNISNQSIDHFAKKIHDIFYQAITQFVPTIDVPDGRIKLSGPTKAWIRTYRRLLTVRNRKILIHDTRNLNEIRAQIRVSRIALSKSIQSDWKIFYINECKGITPGPKMFSKINRFARGRSKFTRGIGQLYFTDQNKTHQLITDEEIANGFADHFGSVHDRAANLLSPFENEANQAVTEIKNTYEPIIFSGAVTAKITTYENLTEMEISVPDHLKNLLTCSEEVCEIISERTKKSSGIDCMPPFIMRHFSMSSIDVITVLFNHITSNGYVPLIFKQSTILPIKKAGKDNEIIAQNRPISQLTQISKNYEKIIEKKNCFHILMKIV
jgi:predicted DNA-binding protein YlxM (UPF0122 family)